MNKEITSARLLEQLKKFREFLINSWDKVDLLIQTHNWNDDPYIIDDWLELNWELLIGRELFGRDILLANYHYYPKRGLEKIVLTGHFPRFLLCCEIDFTDKKNIRDVVSQYKNIPNDDLPLIFSGFLSKCKSGGYGVYPPFDYVSLVGHRSKNIYQIPFHEVSFVLKELE